MTKRTQNILIPVFGTAAFILAAVLVVVLFWPKIQAMISEKTGETAGIDGIGEISYYETPEEHIATDENGFMYADNEMLVVVRDGTSKRAAEKLAKKYDAEIVGCIEATGDYQWRLPDARNVTALKETAEALASEPDVLRADVNYFFTMEPDAVSFDINYGKEWQSDFDNAASTDGAAWSIKAAHVTGAWDFMNERKDSLTPINVGVIDNCFDETYTTDYHFTKTFYNDDANGKVSKKYRTAKRAGHGTHVTGTFAASGEGDNGICGVYPYSKDHLYGVAFAGREKETDLSSCIFHKISFAELILRDVKVINLSLGAGDERVSHIEQKTPGWEKELKELSDGSEILVDFLSRILKKGYDFVLVSAAGNGSQDSPTSLDARYNSFLNYISDSNKEKNVFDHIIVVGSVDKDLQISDFSNGGSRVNVYAPGRDVFSTYPGNTYNVNTGTSMATPLVSGVAALMWTVNPDLTGEQIKDTIIKSAGKTPDGFALIDAEAAVKAAAKAEKKADPATKSQNGSILGFVVDAEKLEVEENTITSGAIANAEVIIKNADTGKEAASVKTDAGGHFEAILPAGTYRLTVKAPSYNTYEWTDDIIVRTGEVTYLDDWVKMTSVAYVKATDADFDALGRDFSADSYLSDLSPTFYTLKDGVFTASFNSDQMDTGDFRKYCFFMTTSLLYERYFKSERVTLENDDPFSGDMLKSNHRYIRYSEENLKWLAKHVLNMTQPFDREEFLAGDSTTCQFHEGYYYFPEIGYDLDRDPWAKIDSYEQIDESSYEIKLTYEFNYNGERSDAVGEGTLLAGVKEVDGKRIWSFYQYEANVRHAQNEKTALLKAAPGSYTFSSGVGSWATSLTLNDDWTFKGEFHDYNATGIYVCSFTGSFSKPERVSDYCYSMKLLSLDYEPAGREYYENNMLHITAEPHGLVGGTEFLLYLPGMPLSETAEGFRSWRGHLGASLENASALPSNLYGLYNVTKEYPFFKALN